MKVFVYRTSYKRDLKRISKRNYRLSLLADVLNALRAGEALPPARRDHSLKGEWSGFRECHIEPDWLLIYQTTTTEVHLVRTGTHADLFNS